MRSVIWLFIIPVWQLYKIRNSYKSDLLIQWKFLICFSAFPQSKALLVEEEQFIPEAQRSLIILNTKRVE